MPAVAATEPSDEHDVDVPGPDLRDGLANREPLEAADELAEGCWTGRREPCR